MEGILIVEPDHEQRELISDWLVQDGFDPLLCPGPTAEDYVCLAVRGVHCPLASNAGIVILDMYLESDAALRGTPGWEILDYYLSAGKRVVALRGDEDPMIALPDEDIEVIKKPIEREALREAVHRLRFRAKAEAN